MNKIIYRGIETNKKPERKRLGTKSKPKRVYRGIAA